MSYETLAQETGDKVALTNAVIEYLALSKRMPDDCPERTQVNAKLSEYNGIVDALLVQSVGQAIGSLSATLPADVSVARYLKVHRGEQTLGLVMDDLEAYTNRQQVIDRELAAHAYTEGDLLVWYFKALQRAGKITAALPPTATLTDMRSVLHTEGYEPADGWQARAPLTVARMAQVLGGSRWLDQGAAIFSADGIYAAITPPVAAPRAAAPPLGPVSPADQALMTDVAPPATNVGASLVASRAAVRIGTPAMAELTPEERIINGWFRKGNYTQKKLMRELTGVLAKKGKTMPVPPSATMSDYLKVYEDIGFYPTDGWQLSNVVTVAFLRDFMNRPAQRFTTNESPTKVLVEAMTEALGAETVNVTGVAVTGAGTGSSSSKATSIRYVPGGTLH